MDNWKKEIVFTTVLYHAIEKGLALPIDPKNDDVLEPFTADLQDMYNHDLLKFSDDGIHYLVDQKGIDFLASMVKIYHLVIDFNIFTYVDLRRVLNKDEHIEDDENECWNYLYDPRFCDKESDDTEDLRLAMMFYLSEQLKGKVEGSLNAYRVVFVQMMVDGLFNQDHFWWRLKTEELFNDVERIVDSAFKWTEIDRDGPNSAHFAGLYYQFGMTEVNKRNGDCCQNEDCKIPLFYYLDNNGDYPADCPACGEELYDEPEADEPEEELEVIPAISSNHFNNHDDCHEVIEQPMWTCDYGYDYDDYYYYDSYNPVADALAIGILCAVLI